MNRDEKIQLLQYWLASPENMGNIPDHMKETVSANDYFMIKKELKWKPLTEKNVKTLLMKTRFGYNSAGRRNDLSYSMSPEKQKAVAVMVVLIFLGVVTSVFITFFANTYLLETVNYNFEADISMPPVDDIFDAMLEFLGIGVFFLFMVFGGFAKVKAANKRKKKGNI